MSTLRRLALLTFILAFLVVLGGALLPPHAALPALPWLAGLPAGLVIEAMRRNR